MFRNDEDLLEALGGTDTHRISAALRYLYQNDKIRGTIARQVVALGGSNDDVRESLHQAIAVFYTHVTEKRYNPALSAVSTWLTRIAVQIFHTRRRSEIRRAQTLDRASEELPAPVSFDPAELTEIEFQTTILDKILASAGERCRQLMKLRSFDYSMAEIAGIMGYRNQDVAKNAASDCRKKINEFLAGNPSLLSALKSV